VRRSTDGSCSVDGSSASGIDDAFVKRESTPIFCVVGSSGGGVLYACGIRACVFSLNCQYHFHKAILFEKFVYPLSIIFFK